MVLVGRTVRDQLLRGCVYCSVTPSLATPAITPPFFFSVQIRERAVDVVVMRRRIALFAIN